MISISDLNDIHNYSRLINLNGVGLHAVVSRCKYKQIFIFQLAGVDAAQRHGRWAQDGFRRIPSLIGVWLIPRRRLGLQMYSYFFGFKVVGWFCKIFSTNDADEGCSPVKLLLLLSGVCFIAGGSSWNCSRSTNDSAANTHLLFLLPDDQTNQRMRDSPAAGRCMVLELRTYRQTAGIIRFWNINTCKESSQRWFCRPDWLFCCDRTIISRVPDDFLCSVLSRRHREILPPILNKAPNTFTGRFLDKFSSLGNHQSNSEHAGVRSNRTAQASSLRLSISFCSHGYSSLRSRPVRIDDIVWHRLQYRGVLPAARCQPVASAPSSPCAARLGWQPPSSSRRRPVPQLVRFARPERLGSLSRISAAEPGVEPDFCLLNIMVGFLQAGFQRHWIWPIADFRLATDTIIRWLTALQTARGITAVGGAQPIFVVTMASHKLQDAFFVGLGGCIQVGRGTARCGDSSMITTGGMTAVLVLLFGSMPWKTRRVVLLWNSAVWMLQF